MRPPRNGVRKDPNPARGGNRASGALSIVGTTEPLGRAPQGMSKEWKKVWQYLKDEIGWLNESHRLTVIDAVEHLLDQTAIREYFAARRAEFVAAGRPAADAFLTDDGTRRHPLRVELSAVSDSVRKSFYQLRLSPSAQGRIEAAMPKVIDVNEAQDAEFFDS